MSNPGKNSPKPLAATTLARVFAADARIAAWSARVTQEAALTALIRRQLPRPLGQRVYVAGARAGSLEIAASAGAVATAVRQRTPDLIAALRREGCDFTEIRVRVQVGAAAEQPQKPLSRQLDARADSLFELAARLPDGPLKRSLDRWARRARGRSVR